MKKKFMMMLLSAMIVMGSMSIAHAAEPDEDIADEIIDVSDEKLTVYDGEEIAPRMDSLRNLFNMNYRNLLSNEMITTHSSDNYIYGEEIDTKALQVTVTPNVSKSDNCSMIVGICYQSSMGDEYITQKHGYRSFNSLKGGTGDIYIDPDDTKYKYYGFVKNNSNSGAIYGSVQFYEYVNW